LAVLHQPEEAVKNTTNEHNEQRYAEFMECVVTKTQLNRPSVRLGTPESFSQANSVHET
jgi:hypothetical protein